MAFLPVSKEEMLDRGWHYCDFLLITGDAYVDHPSFGAAVIGRVLEAEGYRVAILSQPDWRDVEAFRALGRPRYATLITAGNIDSMVAHYTVSKRRRTTDYYSPGGKMGLRPDRACTVYAKMARRAFPGVPVCLGGLEASLRRFAHYDYWADRVFPSLLLDSEADILMYGMGEHSVREIARRLKAGEKAHSLTDIKGTCVLVDAPDRCRYPALTCESFEAVRSDKAAYARAAMLQYDAHDAPLQKAVLQRHGDRWLLQNPPAPPLTTEELDFVAELPYERAPHPSYDSLGGVPGIEEVQFSIIHNRGCFGACNFCSLAFHQGRTVTVRSHASVLREAETITRLPGFKGYIHDVGGPTANFRRPSCEKQLKSGMCKNRRCLSPGPCPNLQPDHTDYLALLRKLRQVPGVKKVFIRSGIRFDYLMADPKGEEFFRELVRYHVSGQLKVAPEHCADSVLDYMGKPHFETYQRFEAEYKRLNEKYGLKQFLVPYLISSHPGCTLEDAVSLTEYLNATGRHPEQVQDFYPTPGTLSTCMYYTELDPRTMRPVYVPKSREDKAMQRALLQWTRPEKRELVLAALQKSGREDLVGYEKNCLIRPAKRPGSKGKQKSAPPEKPVKRGPVKKKAGWAKAKPKNGRGGKKGGR